MSLHSVDPVDRLMLLVNFLDKSTEWLFVYLQIHFVNKRIGFNSTGAAVVSGDSDALAVLGFFFKVKLRLSCNGK